MAAVGALGLLPVTAGAAPAWAIVPSVNGTAPAGHLPGLSCTSATTCTAVGDYYSSAGADVTLAEAWNGVTWAIERPPNPAGAQGSSLSGVSCTSATTCTAVGYFENGGGTDVTLAESWNGAKWAIELPQNPAGSLGSVLSAVSCASATACTAVGHYVGSGGTDVTLAEAWNGVTWAIEDTPNRTGVQNNSLSGVSCISSTTCIAVGDSFTTMGTGGALAEAWNGTTWVIEPTPKPTGARRGSLAGVSCIAASACTAVGTYSERGGSDLTLVEAWNGTTWAIETTPSRTGSSSLSGVSCTSTTACIAVGNHYNRAGFDLTLAEAWNGTTWAVVPTPNPSGGASSSLSGVSCTSATACTAVGSYASNSADNVVTLAEAWNGTTWAIEPTPNPSGASGISLSGVSCTSGTACTAVGYDTDGADDVVTLAEAWDGSTWAIEPTPNPTGATFSLLSGVSCTSATACTAVGEYLNSGDSYVTLAEVWNGTTWAIERTPNPTGLEFGVSTLSGVSCTSTTACTAVGEYLNSGDSYVTLAEARNGTKWAIEPTPSPAGGADSSLSGVSCTAATACTSIGSYSSVSAVTTLAEVWNGTTWTIEPTPNPAAGGSLSGVSCASSTACTAVGNGGPDSTLAEEWNGETWTIEPTPDRAGAKYNFLSGLSCTPAGTCIAVGYYTPESADADFTLTERYS